MIKFAVFDTKPYDIAPLEKHAVGTPICFKFFEPKLTADTVSLAKGFDGVVAFVNDTLDKQVIDKLHQYKIKLIALRCAGFNNVDVKSAFEKIHIVRVPEYSSYAVAEHTMGLILTSVRRIHKAYNRTKEFNFSLAGLTGFDLHGKTVGIIGTGKIGCTFAQICNGFGLKILGYDLYPNDDFIGKYVSLEQLYKKSDIISLHCPLTKDTFHMIDAKAISKMKKGVIIVNTSRGALIEAEDLLAGIKEKKIGAACLDVYEEEAELFFEDNSGHIINDDTLALLLSMPNVLITSHQAFLTEDALENIAKITVKNILSFFEKDQLPNEICYKCSKQGDCKKKRKQKCF